MKKVINGKLYDTETAELVGETTIDCIKYDYDAYVDELLYRKRTGEFFIFRNMCGDGDAFDVYDWTMEHRFEPISEEDARAWAERYLDGDDYISIFGKPEE